MLRQISLVPLLLLFLAPSALWAQGLLIDSETTREVRLPRRRPTPQTTPQDSYAVKELDVRVRLREQVARVQVSQSFVNTGSRQMEVCFVFPLPYDGAVEQMTLLVDGKEYPARLLKADEARNFYEEIVRKNRDPALLEWMGAGLFKTSVFPVPPGAERKVTLRYSQLCRHERGVTDFLFPLSTAKYTARPVEKIAIRVNIESGEEIKSVYSPTHAVEVSRQGASATISYTSANETPTSDFRLFHDVGAGKLAASVLSFRPNADEDGYFLLLASPQIKADQDAAPKKNVIFVVDRSGSMSGEKIEQAKGALRFVLNNLREGDLFNIVAYDSAVESFRPELQRFNDESRAAALGFVEGIYAGGSTNIDGALGAALGQLTDSSRPSYVVFLTDGLPTAGETNEMKIAQRAQQANHVRARLMAFGVGYDVNSRLLDRLARANFGQSEFVRPNEDIEARVSALYNKIKSPVMADVSLALELDDAVSRGKPPINRVYPRDIHDLFEGEQLVVLGRYRHGGVAKVVVTGQVEGGEQRFDFPAELVKKSGDESHAFIEKLWASRRIGEIIDELDLKGKNDELIAELVALSTKHGILTPYTSFLADENTSVQDLAQVRVGAEVRLRGLAETNGRFGFSQRDAKRRLKSAALAPTAGAALAYDEQADEAQPAYNVQQVGAKTFYRRKDQWVDPNVTAEKEKHALRITQFTPEYFEFVRQHGKTVSQYLVFDEPVLLDVEGQAYLIEPRE